MINYIDLDGSMRTEMGSASTNRMRKQGFIPAVIYGNGDPKNNIYIYITKREFNKEYLKGGIQTRPIQLSVEGKKKHILVYDIDLDPVSDLPRHVDFISIEGKSEVKVKIPVKYTGSEKSPGLKRGGFLNVLKRRIQFYVDPQNIPEFVEIDVSKAHIGDKVKISALSFPDNLRLVDKSNFNVYTITGRGKSRVEGEEGGEGAASAAPASKAVKAVKAAPAKAAPAAKAPAAKAKK